jgi:hypothetical protein
MRPHLYLCAVVSLLASCATNVSSSYKPDAATGKGLIVGSITTNTYGGEYYVNVYSYALSKPLKLSAGSANWHPFAKVNDSELNARGDTFAVEAPAGDYFLGGWVVRQGPKRYWGNKELGFPFKVEAGKVTYIGNIHFVDKEYVNLQEREKRDLPVIEARYPAAKSAPLAFKIAEGTKLERLGGEGSWKVNHLIFIPVVPR